MAVTVVGSSGTPTGNITIAGGGYDSSAETLASGSYTFTVPAGSIAPGAYSLTGSYLGDSTYAEASGTATVTLKKAVPVVTITTNPTSVGAPTTGP